MDTKVCSKCGVEKPTDQFNKRAASHDGLVASCKECNRTPEEREKQRERSRRYNQTEKGKLKNREKARRNFHNNPKTRAYLIGYEKRRRKSDPEFAEKSRAYRRVFTREWREKNPDSYRESFTRTNKRHSADPIWRAQHAEYERTRRQERQRNDPEYHKRLMDLAKRGWHKRRARLAGNGGSYTRSEWRRLCDYYEHRCVCCGGKFHRLTVDHVIPLSKGGSNYIRNIQPLCRSCNSKKHDKEIDYRPSLPDWFVED
ncbi:MAG TPA: HNH endonuclease signature motif containing protein [Methylomicrobium sp.]|nr:HNH endonuclease signature motif containing protein [Methylomicrobium sp.]